MESENKTKIVKNENKEFPSFINIKSASTKDNIIDIINKIIKINNESNEIKFNQLPKHTQVNISFWVKNNEKQCGLTITNKSKTQKWGWSYYEGVFKPCLYMKEMNLDTLLIEGDDCKKILEILFDNGYKYEVVSEVYNSNK